MQTIINMKDVMNNHTRLHAASLELGNIDPVQHSLQDILDDRCLQALMQNSPDGVSIHAADGTILEANHRLQSLLHVDHEQLVGRHLKDFAFSGDAHNEIPCAFDTKPTLMRFRHRSGDIAIVQFTTIPVAGGRARLFLSIGRDITEHVRAAEHLLATDRMAALGFLAAGVAHEINNPLAAILANLEFLIHGLARGDGNTNEVSESVRDSMNAAERMRDIVRDLSKFSRKEEKEVCAVDVRKVIDSCLRMAGHEIKHRATVEREFSTRLTAHANEGLLAQVLLNLIINAAQAIPEGNPSRNKIRVVLKEAPHNCVTIEIADTGPGISPTVAANLFTPFVSTKPPGVGTGLGLSICRRIVSELGGQISLENSPNGGAIARVVLPSAPCVATPR